MRRELRRCVEAALSTPVETFSVAASRFCGAPQAAQNRSTEVLRNGLSDPEKKTIEDAIKADIPYETVRAAIDLTAAVNAGVVLRTAIEGAERHNIDALCSGAECAVGTP